MTKEKKPIILINKKNMFVHHKEKNPFIYYFITGTGLVIFWRGLWGLLDIYLFPGNPLLSYVVSAGIGLVILYINDFSLSELSK